VRVLFTNGETPSLPPPHHHPRPRNAPPQTPAEATLWRAVRNRQFGYKFRRQHPVDRFFIDFYCAEAKLLIAVDGASHLEPEQQEYNKLRTEYLEELGYKVIRFTNDDVKFNIQGVTGEILQTVESRIIELKVNK
jgi:very-short-patch-repair endonuclease